MTPRQRTRAAVLISPPPLATATPAATPMRLSAVSTPIAYREAVPRKCFEELRRYLRCVRQEPSHRTDASRAQPSRPRRPRLSRVPTLRVRPEAKLAQPACSAGGDLAASSSRPAIWIEGSDSCNEPGPGLHARVAC